MKVTKISMMSGVEHTREMDVTSEQLRKWQAGALIQDVMKHLSDDDREFLMTGITPEEWKKYLGEER